MNQQNALLESIAGTIADYREGQIPRPTPAHVEKWISQFDAGVRLPILQEMDHVLKKTYFSKDRVLAFLREMVTNRKLTGGNPVDFWQNVQLLKIQQRGSSQKVMVKMLSEVLRENLNVTVSDRNVESDTFVYLDDGIFTGNTITNDVHRWINASSPTNANLHVVTLVQHAGQYFAKNQILQAAESAQKEIKLFWWRKMFLENRMTYRHRSDVLWPTVVPDEASQEYADSLKYPPKLRPAGGVGANRLFSSDARRQILESEFLKRGVHIRGRSSRFVYALRPLGSIILENFGFGSLVVTYRNCPNNTPLALWANNPWYPLFPRVTN